MGGGVVSLVIGLIRAATGSAFQGAQLLSQLPPEIRNQFRDLGISPDLVTGLGGIGGGRDLRVRVLPGGHRFCSSSGSYRGCDLRLGETRLSVLGCLHQGFVNTNPLPCNPAVVPDRGYAKTPLRLEPGTGTQSPEAMDPWSTPNDLFSPPAWGTTRGNMRLPADRAKKMEPRSSGYNIFSIYP